MFPVSDNLRRDLACSVEGFHISWALDRSVHNVLNSGLRRGRCCNIDRFIGRDIGVKDIDVKDAVVSR
jgi:hypothetical protein